MNVDCDVYVAEVTGMDVLVPCAKCGQLRRKSNMSRHARICYGSSTPSATPDARSVKSSTAATGALPRSRSSSADTRSSFGAGRQVVSTSIGDAAYSPTQLSTLLNAVILEAVPALLDQHGCYNQDSLVQYLAKFYPEIPEQFRAPIVVAATAGARHSALMHLVWEKNINSPDQGKRQFASGAASSLSFWALGMLPVHRSGNVYQRKEAEDPSATNVYQTGEHKSATLEPPTATASEDLPAVQDKAVVLNDIIFPAPLRDVDEEFEDLMAAAGANAQSVTCDLFPEIQSVAEVPQLEKVQSGNKSSAVEQRKEGDQATPHERSEASPVLSIHAISDIESDGEVHKASSIVTVHTAMEGKVMAQASVKRSSEVSKTSESVHRTQMSNKEERKRVSPRRQCRQESPRRKQPRSGFSRRPPATYMVRADEYREFRDYIRRHGPRYRK